MRTTFLLALPAAALLAACSSTVGGAGGQSSSGTTTSGAGGCQEPTEGESCSDADVACQPADPCCAGYEWTCPNGTWFQAGLGCACIPDTFACGKLLCGAGEICVHRPPGVDAGEVPPDAYVNCEPTPSTCTGTPTCACAADARPGSDPCSTQNPGVTCTDDGAGHVTLQCMGQ